MTELGYSIQTMNYRVRQAELDIVALDKGTVVFAEVKYRRDISSGYPLEAVDREKQKRICRAALYYLNRHGMSVYDTSIRFDVIGILGGEITHIKNAFDYIM